MGHSVTALVRNPASLANMGDALTLVTGDIHNLSSVEKAVQGQDAVICALGVRDLKKTMIRTEGTVNIIRAMKKHNIMRLFVVSAMGVGDRWNSLSLLNKFIFAVLLKSARADPEAQEAAVKASGLMHVGWGYDVGRMTGRIFGEEKTLGKGYTLSAENCLSRDEYFSLYTDVLGVNPQRVYIPPDDIERFPGVADIPKIAHLYRVDIAFLLEAFQRDFSRLSLAPPAPGRVSIPQCRNHRRPHHPHLEEKKQSDKENSSHVPPPPHSSF